MKKTDQWLSAGDKTQTMKPTIKKTFLSATAVISLACLASSHAAVITWGTAQNITGDSDVSTLGTFNRAYSFDVSSATVNGVTFSPFSAQANDTQLFSTGVNPGGYATAFGGGGSDPWNILSASYKTLLAQGLYNDVDYARPTITLNNLSIGTQYQIQIWVNDSRNIQPAFNRAISFYSGATPGTDNSPVMQYNVGNAGGGLGQFATGTFTADGTSITLSADNYISGGAQINALQLSVIPEPATYALVLGGILPLLALLRRRA